MAQPAWGYVLGLFFFGSQFAMARMQARVPRRKTDKTDEQRCALREALTVEPKRNRKRHEVVVIRDGRELEALLEGNQSDRAAQVVVNAGLREAFAREAA